MLNLIESHYTCWGEKGGSDNVTKLRMGSVIKKSLGSTAIHNQNTNLFIPDMHVIFNAKARLYWLVK